MAEHFRYLRRFVAAPARIGSVAPSSQSLARAMVRGIDWDATGVVAELGAGTGVFTQAVVGALAPGARFLVFEAEPALRRDLLRRFPALELHEDAATLGTTLAAGGLDGADCIISGLPFANFRPLVRQTLLRVIFGALRPGGVFVGFQYSTQLRRELRACFGAVETEVVLRNVPPAVVYRCRRQPLEALHGLPGEAPAVDAGAPVMAARAAD